MNNKPSRSSLGTVLDMLGDPEGEDLARLLGDGQAMAALSSRARVALADGLVKGRRWKAIGKAIGCGHLDLFRKWGVDGYGSGEDGRGLSRFLSPEDALGQFEGEAAKSLAAASYNDMAERVRGGDWAIWESRKTDKAFLAALDGWNGGWLFGSLLGAIADEKSAIPEDLKARAIADGRRSPMWDAGASEPDMSSWGYLSRRIGAYGGAVHALIEAGKLDQAICALSIVGFQEYGSSPLGPIDSAFRSGSWEAVEKISANDPLMPLRPVLGDRGWGEARVHVPLAAYFEDLAKSTSPARGLWREGAEGVRGRLAGLGEVAGEWLGRAYEAVGSESQRRACKNNLSDFEAAASTGRLGVDDALSALVWWSMRASAELGLAPRVSAGAREAMRKGAYGEGLGALAKFEDENLKAAADEVGRLAKLSRSPGFVGPKALETEWERMERIRAALDAMPNRQEAEAVPKAALPPVSSSVSAKSEEPTALAPRAVVEQVAVEDLAVKLVERRRAGKYDKEMTGALRRAVAQCDPAAAKRALFAGADPNGRVGQSDTMLARALKAKDPEARKLLVDMIRQAGGAEEAGKAVGAKPR